MLVNKEFRLRSYVRRVGRITMAQRCAYETFLSQFGLQLSAGLINYRQVFQRTAPCILEIGFGTGQSLLALAKNYPHHDFIGVETHKPGIGALLQGIKLNDLNNVRVYESDAIDVLTECIPNLSLDGIQLFFPDPWQKRRHAPRRLIQPAFVNLLVTKLKPGAFLHLATDWEDYAKHMLRVVTQEPQLTNLAGLHQYATRSPQRPVLTKFESRAEHEGRKVWDLQLSRQ